MEFLTVPQAAVLLRWKQCEVLAALRTGVLAGVQVPGKVTKWAVLHPGVLFVEYQKHPEARLPYMAVFSQNDVAAIIGKGKEAVRWHQRQGHIKPIVFPGIRMNRAKHLFTAWEVRRLIMYLGKPDPFLRPTITAEVMKEFFKKSMIAKVPVDPLDRMNEELRWICEMPEPERSHELAKLIRMAEDMHRKQLEEARAAAASQDKGSYPHGSYRDATAPSSSQPQDHNLQDNVPA